MLAGLAMLLLAWAAAAAARIQPAPSGRSAQSNSDVPAGELLREVVSNELKVSHEDHSRWMYEDRTKQSGQETTTRVIETSQGHLNLLVARNGRALDPEQEKKEKARARDLAAHPDRLQAQVEAAKKDSAKTEHLFSILPQAVKATYGVRRGAIVELKFEPNPAFHASSRMDGVFHAMSGSIWVNEKEHRLVEIEGALTRRVDFGGGLLGHLDAGGKFDVKQEEIGPGHWDISELHVHMRGKALFFKTIGVEEDETRSQFQEVPENITLAQAAEKLEGGAQVSQR